MLGIWLFTLVGTLLTELPIVWWLARDLDRRQVLATAFFANLASHSLASHAILLGQPDISFELAELLVVLLEFAAFRFVARVDLRPSLRLALFPNAVTIAVSLFVLYRG